MRIRLVITTVCLLLAASHGYAAIYGTVSGSVEDPQHRGVPDARIVLARVSSGWRQEVVSDGEGRFQLTTVPAGDYTISVMKDGFQTTSDRIVVRSGTVTPLALTLVVGPISETVEVAGAAAAVNTKSATTASLLGRDELEHVPGGLASNSLEMATQFVPGSYLVHDQLHIRGGHQVSWLVDGVPVPNTNIASNVGPQFDPKDVDTIEMQRGGYSAEFGERMYGVFNVIPRSGFERSRQAELVGSYGNLNETNDQINLGDHTDRVAYYASVSANCTDLGLEPPVPDSLHNSATGVSGFGSFIYKPTASNQFRLVTSVRGDRYDIPNTPDDQASGVDNRQHERDGFVNISWLHTIGSSAFLTVSPFYHYNRTAFEGGGAQPIVTTDRRTSQYLGVQAALAVSKGRHDARVGAYAYSQRDAALFGLDSPETGTSISQSQHPAGHVEVGFAQEQFAATDWLTFNFGLRLTHFAGQITENAADPRVGVAVRLPKGQWALRAFYGRYYQPPPLTTISGPLLEVAAEDGFGFLPLKAERDAQYEVGLAVPLRRWAVDVDWFRTDARNFFDHDAVGNSNIFIPLTIDRARIRAFEATLRAPRKDAVQVHLAYSHQYVEGRGGITGGLTDFAPAEGDGYYFLDHDQRDTLSAGVDVALRAGAWVSATLGYGSGFLTGDGPDHNPAHAVFNLQAGKSFGKRWVIVFSAMNVADTRFLLDESNTFGGTHYNTPRQVSAGIRYRFHY